MVSFSSLLLACTATAAVWAAPTKDNEKHELVARQSTNVGAAGTNNGYYYAFFTEGVGRVTYTNGAGGQYKVTWSNAGYFYAGKGWNPGSANDITYSGTYSPTDNSFLAVYGWTTSPLTEYYIVESYGTVDPSSLASQKGSVTTDGGTYTILETTRTNEPSIEGTATYQQYWSVRTSHRVGGTITTSNHFNAWAALGMPLGTFNWQLLSIQAYNSSGSASITIETGPSSGTTTASTTAPSSGTCASKYGQCGGIQWAGPTCCQSGSTCTYISAYYTQCL